MTLVLLFCKPEPFVSPNFNPFTPRGVGLVKLSGIRQSKIKNDK